MNWLDIDTWDRKEHFYFFKTFEEPFFGICVNVDCTHTYLQARDSKGSFFLFYLHKLLRSVNETQSFHFRIVEDKVLIHDHIDVSATIIRENDTFGFTYIPYVLSFEDFEIIAMKEIEKVKSSDKLFPDASYTNLIHFSSMPWLQFSSVSHARKFSSEDSVPKITTGKVFDENGKKMMPVSVHVHHALMDGLQVAEMLKKFQQYLSE